MVFFQSSSEGVSVKAQDWLAGEKKKKMCREKSCIVRIEPSPVRAGCRDAAGSLHRSLSRRPCKDVAALLDLPVEVLVLILGLLGTKSRAAARLTCRALRDAIACADFVTIHVKEYFTAKVRVSARILAVVSFYASSFAELDFPGVEALVRHARCTLASE